jgi:hypothetical protein
VSRKTGSVNRSGDGGLTGTLGRWPVSASDTPGSPPTPRTLTVQREALAVLGVAPDRVYVDHGLTGTNRERPGLRQALAACRAGDTLAR